jgi:hypothetical protein
MTVDRSGEMVDSRVLIEVRVFNDTQLSELFEYPVDSRGTDVRSAFLDFLGNFVSGEMIGRIDQHFGQSPLGDRHPFGGVSDCEN